MAKRSEVVGWCLFDVANSSYTTVIITVFFGRIFSEAIVGPDPEGGYATGNLYWALALGVSGAIAALTSPLFGAMSDVSRHRKRYLGASVLLCSVATAALYSVEPGMIWWASFLILLSFLGFSLSENFISAFLPHISTPQNIGKISGWGWGLGYLGGLMSIILCQGLTGVEGDYSAEVYDQLRLVGPATGLYFLLFSLPTFIFVSEPESKKQATGNWRQTLREGYQTLLNTAHSLQRYRDLARFLLSFFFFYGGLSIVISFAAIYASQVAGITGSWQAIFFVTLQLTAVIGAVSFGYLQDKIGALRSVNITLVIWISTVLAIYFLQDIVEMFAIENFKLAFIMVSNFAGFCLGATQSSARAIVGMFSPPEHSGEFYGFWGFAGKFAAVFANITFGILQNLLDLQTALLACSAFFMIGLWLNFGVNEQRGRANAAQR